MGFYTAFKGLIIIIIIIIMRKLNMDHLKAHLTSDSSKKIERNWTNESDGAKRR
jgi:hypothetical protein